MSKIRKQIVKIHSHNQTSGFSRFSSFSLQELSLLSFLRQPWYLPLFLPTILQSYVQSEAVHLPVYLPSLLPQYGFFEFPAAVQFLLLHFHNTDNQTIAFIISQHTV